MSEMNGRAGWGSYKALCFYCKAAVVTPLPTTCWCCGRKLSEVITPEMKLSRLSDLCVANGGRLNIEAIPIRGS